MGLSEAANNAIGALSGKLLCCQDGRGGKGEGGSVSFLGWICFRDNGILTPAFSVSHRRDSCGLPGSSTGSHGKNTQCTRLIVSIPNLLQYRSGIDGGLPHLFRRNGWLDNHYY